ncbi:MAG TPA: hypothetical protein VGO96_11985 [Pyrinomonadaceae bacterium]|jgi:hypothetical protein|nr:hypothetical protein [Pyrinomonadaceae bacterium]
MIFTDKFVYVHEPKTGGTFVTSVLFRLYGLKWNRFVHLQNMLRGEIRGTGKYGTIIHNNNKHGGCREIPAAQREKPVLATVRNPYDLYVSQYEFGWWKRKEFLPYFRAAPSFEQFAARFPDRITFAEYVRLANAAFRDLAPNGDGASVGFLSEQFLKFYFRNPQEARAKLADVDYARSQKYRADMFDLHFIRTDELNRGLYDFLLRMNYGHEDIAFILELGRILPQGRGRSDGGQKSWERYYTPELKREVRHQERFLFALFPEFDV